MKTEFPGDADFQHNRFWDLPYEYILSAVSSVNYFKRQRLHEYERPIAVLAWQQAELNRDKKKKRQPYTLDDFYLYGNESNINAPNARYGAAAKKLIQMEKFPLWGLFVYKDLISQSENALPPDDLAAIASDCIVIAPIYEDFECSGMLIALESASGQLREFTSINGQVIQMRVPELQNKVNAIEDAVLKVLR